VRTHGTPQQIVHDQIAINEYLGTGFNDGTLAPPPRDSADWHAPAEQGRAGGNVTAVHLVLEQEKIRRLVEGLKSAEQLRAAEELVQKGFAAVPALIDALERRDVELRRQAFQVLQHILETVSFDPYAPEALRQQQILNLREQFQRKAG
jgi:lipopolysaccharide export system ATP-binding protein